MADKFNLTAIQYERNKMEEKHYMGKLKLLYAIDNASALPGKINVTGPSIFFL
jgi:hypothetical protein